MVSFHEMDEDGGKNGLSEDELADTQQHFVKGKMPEVDNGRVEKLGNDHCTVSEKEEELGISVDESRRMLRGNKHKGKHRYIQDDKIIEGN